MILNESINNNNYYDSLNIDYNRLLNEQYYGSNKYTYQIDDIMEQAIILSKNKNTVENNKKLQELAFKLENILVKMFNFKYPQYGGLKCIVWEYNNWYEWNELKQIKKT